MALTVWGQVFETADLTNAAMFQPFKTNKNMLLSGVRSQFVVVNDPTFTDLNMKIYSYDGTSAGNLIATSTNSIAKASLHTAINGVKETFFQFANIPLNGNTTYAAVINGTGYVFGAASFLAWKKDFPNPAYRTGLVIDNLRIGVDPFHIAIIGASI